jgi:hypothetical protein
MLMRLKLILGERNFYMTMLGTIGFWEGHEFTRAARMLKIYAL